MADIKGFPAFRYNKARIGNMSDVITPPFDVIDAEQRAILGAKSPYNYAHLILPEERDSLSKYEYSAKLFNQWIAEGIFKQDDADSYYVLEQKFKGLDDKPHTRRGFFAAVKIPESGEEYILGHERTFESKFQDRLRLMEATGAQYGAVFLMYSDPKHELGFLFDPIASRDSDIAADTIDGVSLRVWRTSTDPRVNDFFKDKTLYIADGHHRFRTAMAYRDHMRTLHGGDGKAPYDYVLVGLVEADDPGFLICPAHRLLDAPEGFSLEQFLIDAQEWFDVQTVEGDVLEHVNAANECTIGLQTKEGQKRVLVLRDIDRTKLLGEEHGPAWRDLDVSVLHGGILEKLMGLDANAMLVYEHDGKKALEMVKSGKKEMVFVLKGVTPRQLFACADAREFMPQKSTYIFPKLPSGAAIHKVG
ncbi:MAG: hypothetical protein AMXMBFR84_03270 [Candidatus Hydrogenedentota bacterium]